MKNYNRLIVLSVCLYLIIAVLSSYWFKKLETERDSMYKVEINRMYNYLAEEIALYVQRGEEEALPGWLAEGGALAFTEEWEDSFQWVKAAAYLWASEQEEAAVAEFYKEDRNRGMEIKPVFVSGQLQGFLRFDYVRAEYDTREVFWALQAGLGVMELLILCVLIYLKYKLLRPFWRMAELPYEMAQGHLKGIVKEEKNRFFGKFLWGLGQLKDSLDTSRRRTLELEKEKKLLLLSLSHDIKTPLNSIRLYVKALKEDLYQKKSERESALERIDARAAEIEQYVEEIMKNSREDILDIQVVNQEFYLQTLMERVLQTYEEKCALRRVELMVGNYENRLLRGDIDRAQEVFENIFENALKYGDGKRIEISFYEEDGRQLVRIFNSGEPVTENEINHIFESFFRAANSRGKPGNGLGLYICREIMRRMGGSIFAKRETDGMAFILVF